LEAGSDSARAFEFLRDAFDAAETGRWQTTFYSVLKQTLARLVREYPGEYNILLSNGAVIWGFTNHRQFLLLKGSRKLEEALLLTTIEDGLSPENWVRLEAGELAGGKIILIAGGDLVFVEDLVSGEQ
jgi:hypothetical protein